MDAIIGVIISTLGSYFSDIDFCTLYTFISIALSIYRSWKDHTDDKTTKR